MARKTKHEDDGDRVLGTGAAGDLSDPAATVPQDEQLEAAGKAAEESLKYEEKELPAEVRETPQEVQSDAEGSDK